MAGVWRFSQFDDVESTNVVVKRAIARGEDEGFVAIARSQSSGYGMRGHTWISPVGGLYMSCLFGLGVERNELHQIPQRLASDLLPHIQEISREELAIKDPNDIVLKDSSEEVYRKLAGISSEIYMGKLCVGIGVNVFKPREEKDLTLDSSTKNEIVYLSDFAKSGVSIEIVRDAILTAWRDWL